MKPLRIVAALMLLSSMAAAINPQVSTPAERKRALAVIAKLEDSPMDPALKDDREWVFQWVKSSDVDAMVCTNLIQPLTEQKPTPERNALMLQNILASARFSIEHPGSKDRVAMFQAATEGLIRSYQNLVRKDPSRKDEFMDSLVAKQQTGELVSYVRRGAKECFKHPATVLEP
jgi:hypothetical protein